MEFKNIHTRFRAYQLGSKGSSFSYWDSDTNKFVLGEARLNQDNWPSIKHELLQCGKDSIDDLYISSWDIDHCSPIELGIILEHLKPSSVYYPRYSPDLTKPNQMESKKLIDSYNGPPKIFKYNGSPGSAAEAWKYGQVFFNPKLTGNPNDDSLITLWRRGNLSVLSVGDLESTDRSEAVSNTKILNEVDVLILAHHGSSRNFTTDSLLKALKPKVCIALVDRKNQYGHPDPLVYQRVNNNSWYYSTKDGDVIIETNGNSNEHFTVYDYISNGQKRQSVKSFSTKKYDEFNRQLIKALTK